MERAVAGAVLSRRMDNDAFPSVEWLHNLLTMVWVVLALVKAAAQILEHDELSGVAVGAVFDVATAYFLITRSRGGISWSPSSRCSES